jgi:putative peptide zinc metalloprotease protein
MSESLFSAYWYRVAELRPRLRSHVELHRHHYRGQLWHLLQDRSAGRQYRFRPAGYAILGRLDGRRTVQDIWHEVLAELGDAAPSQDEIIQLLGRLHAADVLQCDVPPDVFELFERQARQSRVRWKQRFSNPLALRFPLVDPAPFLERALPVVRPLFSVFGAALCLGVIGVSVVLALAHWSELTEDVAERILASHNLILLWLAYPVVKLLHECGHAFATRIWGGEVHEAGVLLLVFMPIPYVDASASSAFASRRQRIVVGAVGILVELFLASLSLWVWLSVEPGWVRTLAYDVMVIGGLSTILFNGNPLLRFDGYYLLSDAIDVPNLGPRSNRYIGYLVQRHAFAMRDIESPVTADGEAPWLFGYAIASFLYRTFVLLVIALFVAERFLVVGVILAGVILTRQLVWPLVGHVRFLLTSPRLGAQRNRAWAASGLALGAALVVLFAIPIPLRTRAEGVIWPPDRSQVRAGADGFVRRLLVASEVRVAEGDALIETDDPFLAARVRVLEARLRELLARRDALWVSDMVEAEVLDGEIAAAQADLDRARERVEEALVRSPGSGRLVLPHDGDVIDRFVRQGEVLGHVTDFSKPIARVVVGQRDIGLVRERTRAVEVRLAQRRDEVIPAVIEREVPSASQQLPTPALGSAGGGAFAVDPSDGEGLTALESVFQFDLALPAGTPVEQIGGRVYVLFDHGSEPLAQRSFRAIRRLFLGRFGV